MSALFSDKQWLALAMTIYDARTRARNIKGDHDQRFGVQLVEEAIWEMLREDNRRFEAEYGYRFGVVCEKGPRGQEG